MMNKFGMTLAAAITGSSVMFGGPALADDADSRIVSHVFSDVGLQELVAISDVGSDDTGSVYCPIGGAVVFTISDNGGDGLKGRVKVIGTDGVTIKNLRRVTIGPRETFAEVVQCKDFGDPPTVRLVTDLEEADDDKDKDDD